MRPQSSACIRFRGVAAPRVRLRRLTSAGQRRYYGSGPTRPVRSAPLEEELRSASCSDVLCGAVRCSQVQIPRSAAPTRAVALREGL